MPGRLKRANNKRHILLSAAIAAAGLVAGCDNAQNQADKRVRATMEEARQIAETGGEGSAEAARAKLNEAASDASASDGLRANVKAAVGRAEMNSASALTRNIDRSELDIARLVGEISALTEQIRGTSTTVAGYRQFDPKPTLDAIATQIAAANGGADKPAWFTNGTVTIPTLAAAKDELSKLDAQLAQKNQQVTGLVQQRNGLLDQAEQGAAQADQQKGAASVEAFRKASDLRKQAGDLAVQIEKTQGEIARIKASMATAKAQVDAANAAIAQLTDQAATIDKAWKDMDARAGAQRQLASEIIGNGATAPAAGANSTAGGTIAQKAAELQRIATAVAKTRDEAQKSLTNASKNFEEADRAANTYVNQLRQLATENPTRPEKESWEAMQKVMDPMQFRLEQAAAQRALGSLYASEASSLQSRIALAGTLQLALANTDLRVPTGIVDNNAVEASKAALAQADLALKESDDLLDKISQGRTQQYITDDALISRALTNYAWAQVARQQNDQASAKTRLGQAIAYRDAAAEHNMVLPAMPAELGAPPKKVAPAPEGATAEGAAPATTEAAAAPATEPAPTTAPQ